MRYSPFELTTRWLRKQFRAVVPRGVPAHAKALHAQLMQEGDAQPRSNGSRLCGPLPLRIGVISDDILFDALAGTATIVALRPDTVQEPVDMVLFITCSSGMGAWPRLGDRTSQSRAQLLAALDAYNARDIPTVFWSTEDPPHFDDFIDVAQRCRFVYTSAQEMVPAYQTRCPDRPVAALPFAINPLHHNPIGSRRARRHEVLFAGAWYAQYVDRTRDMAMIFDAVRASGRELVIIDRNYFRASPSFDFPRRFRDTALPPISHAALQQVQKRFNWCLNFNSVTASETMCASRVPEMQAQGIALISNESRAVARLYPAVFRASSAAHVAAALSTSPQELATRLQSGIRQVMDRTYFDVVRELARAAGHTLPAPQRRVAVVVDEINDRVAQQFAGQGVAGAQLVARRDWTPARVAEFDFVTFWASVDEIAPHQLRDQLQAFVYTNARYVVVDDTAAHEFSDSHATPASPAALFCCAAFAPTALLGPLAEPAAGGYAVPPAAIV